MSFVICTNAVKDRDRGFLRSVTYEIFTGVYVGTDLGARARDAIWDTLREWYDADPRGSLCLIYPDRSKPGGLQIRTLGEPLREFVDADGILLLKVAGPPETFSPP